MCSLHNERVRIRCGKCGGTNHTKQCAACDLRKRLRRGDVIEKLQETEGVIELELISTDLERYYKVRREVLKRGELDVSDERSE